MKSNFEAMNSNFKETAISLGVVSNPKQNPEYTVCPSLFFGDN